MSLYQLSSAISSLGPSLRNHLWQSTIFAAGVVLIALVMRKNYARTRHWIWLAASVKFLIPFSMLMAFGGAFMPHRQPAPAVTAVYEIIDVVGQPFTAATSTGTLIPLPTSSPHAGLSLPSIIPLSVALIWTLGTLSVLTLWGLYWWKVKAAVRGATRAIEGPEIHALRELQAANLGRANVGLYLSSTNLGPGVYGISHPVLIWPARISRNLNDAQIKSILAHELCHIERHDNLTACVHMIVEAIFWFHPLVWWLGSRLELERERACDEHVLQFTKAPRTYAESILKVCEMCLESPLECVSGVTGANLKERITRIMTSHMGQRLTLSRKVLLVATAFSSIAVPIIFGQVASGPISQNATQPLVPKQGSEVATRAQTTPDQGYVKPQMMPRDADPNWDAVTVKPSDPNDNRDFDEMRGRHLIVENETVETLLVEGYGVQKKQIVGGPDWMRSKRFDVDGVPDIVGQPDVPQYQSLLRKLLQQRFGLEVHHDQRVMPMFALTVAKQGPKLTPSKGDPNGTPDVDGGGGNIRESRFTNTSMQDFAIMLDLDRSVDRPVVDRTGIKGRYDFKLRWTVDESKATAPDSPPGFFTAVQEQLGLKLIPEKAPGDVLVIDSIAPPSAN